MRWGHRRTVVRAAIGLAFSAVVHLAGAESACEPMDVGCRIFAGQQPVVAHLRDDPRALPAATARCIQCHTPQDGAPAFAPPLSSGYLLGAMRRRGGPPSGYDQAAFCRALRDGVDPAGVLLRKAMPNFQVSDDECAALWRFVTARHDPPA